MLVASGQQKQPCFAKIPRKITFVTQRSKRYQRFIIIVVTTAYEAIEDVCDEGEDNSYEDAIADVGDVGKENSYEEASEDKGDVHSFPVRCESKTHSFPRKCESIGFSIRTCQGKNGHQ